MENDSRKTETRTYKDAEVQRVGYVPNGAGGQVFWTWGSGDGLPKIEDGKKIVFLYPCNCGCWTEEYTRRAMELIGQDPNPERFVLRRGDPRYAIRSDDTFWYVISRPQYTGEG